MSATAKELIRSFDGMPLTDSIGDIAWALQRDGIIVAAARLPTAENPSLGALFDTDRDGHRWLYAFSDEDEVALSFPQGIQTVTMTFLDVLNMAISNNFNGLYVNASGSTTYPIPGELFDDLVSLLKSNI